MSKKKSTIKLGGLYKNKKTGRVVRVARQANNKTARHLWYVRQADKDLTRVDAPGALPYRIGVDRFANRFERTT